MQYRIKTARTPDWNYSDEAWYYVTICTKDHVLMFGDVVNEEVILNNLGKYCETVWRNIPLHYNSAELDLHIVMPNHIHGILIINSSGNNYTLGNIVGGFKSEVSRWAIRNGFSSFKWQARFYDHIIRKKEDLERVRQYIYDNPLKWDVTHMDI